MEGIKYTKNITNKLKSMGFEFCYEQEKHDEVHYEVWDIQYPALEPACGEGHISKLLDPYRTKSFDLIDRGYGHSGIDFLKYDKTWHGDIITNPPYKFAKEFIEKSLEILQEGNKCAMFLKIQFLEGKARKKLFTKHPPKKIYVSSSRLLCAKNADFDGMKAGGGSAVAYAWFIWEKGFQGHFINWIKKML